MRQTTIRTLGVAAAAALLLTACGNGDTGNGGTDPGTGDGNGGTAQNGGENQPVTLNFTWWGNDDRASRYQEAIALFEEEYDWITVNGNFSDWDSYWTARSTEAAGRSLPDVLQFDLSYMSEYSANGHLLDLTPHIGEQIDLSGFDDALVASGQLDGQQIGIPTSTNTLALFVNPNLVEQAGVDMLDEDYTWEDYNAFIREISEAGESTDEGQAIYGGADYTATFWFFMQWLVQQGTQPFGDDGSINFEEGDIVEFLELAAPLREDGVIYPVERGVQLAPLGGFTVNESASEFSWDNFLAGYTADSGTENIEMLPMPTGPNGEKSMFWKPSMLLSAGANTDHPEEAAMLIDFLLTEPEVGRIFGTSKGVPADQAQRDAMELEEGGIDARVTAFEEEVADHVTEPVPVPVRGFGSIEAEWLRLGEDLNYGMITPQEFADQWFAEARMSIE